MFDAPKARTSGGGGGGYAPKQIWKKLKSTGSEMVFLPFLYGYFLKVVAFLFFIGQHYLYSVTTAQRCGGRVFSYG